MDDVFSTTASSKQILNKIKGSKFYANIARVNSVNEAKLFLEKVKDKYYDASHNVNAYKIYSGDLAIKYSDDDGEPASSSGPPVLQAIEGEGLTNTIIVISRYFGGTKLGIGGLIRAYGETARYIIKEAGKRELRLHYSLKININYKLLGTVLGQVEAFGAGIRKTEYTNAGVDISIIIRASEFNKLEKVLIEKTANTVDIQKKIQIHF